MQTSKTTPKTRKHAREIICGDEELEPLSGRFLFSCKSEYGKAKSPNFLGKGKDRGVSCAHVPVQRGEQEEAPGPGLEAKALPFLMLRRPPACDACTDPACRYCTSFPLSQRARLLIEAGSHLWAEAQLSVKSHLNILSGCSKVISLTITHARTRLPCLALRPTARIVATTARQLHRLDPEAPV